ncbi:MAG: zinc-dependent alcohol dehydrogenase [Thermodesulfobacteriota bacterium]
MQALQFHVTVPRFIAAKILRGIFGRSVFYNSPVATIRLADIPEPVLPSPDWVKIRTRYCGFCGSDLNLILLHDSPTASPFTSFPCITGHEIVGEIVEAGSGAGAFQPGDRVVVNPILGCETRGISPACPACRAGRSGNCAHFADGDLPPGMFLGINRGVNGGFAPFLVAHKSQLFPVPPGLSPEAAVMTEPLAVALQAVLDNKPEGGETVLVIGGGVIGNLMVQSLRNLSAACRIFVIEPSPFAGRLAEEAGAEGLIPAAAVYERTARVTGAAVYKPMLGKEILMGGFHRIYDTVGSAATLNLAMRLLSAMGTLSVVGIGGDVRLDLTPLWLKLQTVKGVYAYGRNVWRNGEAHAFEIALELMRSGKIRAEKLVTHRFRLEEYRRMIEVNLNKGRHKAMKTVVAFP